MLVINVPMFKVLKLFQLFSPRHYLLVQFWKLLLTVTALNTPEMRESRQSLISSYCNEVFIRYCAWCPDAEIIWYYLLFLQLLHRLNNVSLRDNNLKILLFLVTGNQDSKKTFFEVYIHTFQGFSWCIFRIYQLYDISCMAYFSHAHLCDLKTFYSISTEQGGYSEIRYKLFKKLKGALGQKFFWAEIMDFWNGLDYSTVAVESIS